MITALVVLLWAFAYLPNVLGLLPYFHSKELIQTNIVYRQMNVFFNDFFDERCIKMITTINDDKEERFC